MYETEQYYNHALEIVLEAGKILLMGFKSSKEISTKSNSQDFVTQYDKLVGKKIIDRLLQLYPNHKFIAEESAADNILTNEPTWIIDPIDGTTNFIQGFPFCCISLALSIENEIILGIVYNPILNQLFTSQKGKGSYLNNEKIHASNTEDLKNAMLGTKLNFEHDSKITLEDFRGIRSIGLAALCLCYVAMGAIDICMMDSKYIKCWDIAAGILIIRESGGVVLDYDGNEFTNVMKADIFVASTKKLAENVLKLKINK